VPRVGRGRALTAHESRQPFVGSRVVRKTAARRGRWQRVKRGCIPVVGENSVAPTALIGLATAQISDLIAIARNSEYGTRFGN